MTARPPGADTDERRQRRLALVATLVLNGVFLALLERFMQPHATARTAPARTDSVDVLQVRLIEPMPPPEPLPAVASSETYPRPGSLRHDGPAVSAPTQTQRPRRAAQKDPESTAEASQPALGQTQPATGVDAAATDAAAEALLSAAASLRLYDRTGGVLLPDTHAADAAVVAFPERPRVAQEGNPFVHRSPLPYTPTRLDKYWPSTRETLGGELVRKATVKRTWLTPWGTQVECAWVLIFGGCGWGPAPRATAEELQQMRADPPLPKSSPTSGAASDAPSP